MQLLFQFHGWGWKEENIWMWEICFQGSHTESSTAQVRMLSSLISYVPTAKKVIISHKCDT
jgi:hypothetical protein